MGLSPASSARSGVSPGRNPPNAPQQRPIHTCRAVLVLVIVSRSQNISKATERVYTTRYRDYSWPRQRSSFSGGGGGGTRRTTNLFIHPLRDANLLQAATGSIAPYAACTRAPPRGPSACRRGAAARHRRPRRRPIAQPRRRRISY